MMSASRPHPRTRRRGRPILAAVLLACASPAPARTWTSATGSTIDAELTGRDGDYVLLEGADGRQFKIHFTNLSAADQAFLGAPEAAATPEPPVPAVAPAAPRAAPGPPLGPVSFAPPAAMTTDRIPGLEPPAFATGSIGLQFGPNPDDVLYLVVDAASLNDLPRALYVCAPGRPDYATATLMEGRRSKHNDQRVIRFGPVALAANFGPVQAAYEMEVICGIERPDIVAVLIDVRLEEAGRSDRLSLGGYINEPMLRGAGPVPVLPILAHPELEAKVNTRPYKPTVSPRVNMGPFAVRPPNRKIALVVTETSGKPAEKQTVRVTEDDLLAYQPTDTRTILEKLDPDTAYILHTSADLGDLFGEVEQTTGFTTRADKR